MWFPIQFTNTSYKQGNPFLGLRRQYNINREESHCAQIPKSRYIQVKLTIDGVGSHISYHDPDIAPVLSIQSQSAEVLTSKRR